MAKKYTSTIEVNCWKEHTCIACGAVYSYQFRRKIQGQGSTPEKAEASARALADKRSAREVDLQPCPTCGLYQPAMVGQQRAKWHWRIFWLSLILFLVLIFLRVCYAIQTDRACWMIAAVCAFAALVHITLELRNPNGNTSANRNLASQRVASGILRGNGGQPGIRVEKFARPARTTGYWAALAMLVMAVPLAMLPELMRTSQGWPLNLQAYPPVVGPGDQTRIYMQEKIESIKGYWRGNIVSSIQAPGARAQVLRATTNQNDWGDKIYAKSSETKNTLQPWVSIVLPEDSSLAGKAVTCTIDLSLQYPHLTASKSFITISGKMHRSMALNLASVHAGQRYTGWWWEGILLGSGLILVAGIILVKIARALQASDNPSRLLPNDLPVAAV